MLRSVLSTSLSLVLIVMPAAGVPAGDQPAGQVKALLPDASRNGQSLAVNAALQWNDLLKTNAKGRVRVGLTDGSILSVGSNSELKVVQHDAKSQQTSIELKYGELRNQVTKITQPGGKYEVKTANAVIGVIGTDFYVGYANHRTTVICYEGQVTVTLTDNNTSNGTSNVIPLIAGKMLVVGLEIPPGGYHSGVAPAMAVQTSLLDTGIPAPASGGLNESGKGTTNAPTGNPPNPPEPTTGSTPPQAPSGPGEPGTTPSNGPTGAPTKSPTPTAGSTPPQAPSGPGESGPTPSNGPTGAPTKSPGPTTGSTPPQAPPGPGEPGATPRNSPTGNPTISPAPTNGSSPPQAPSGPGEFGTTPRNGPTGAEPTSPAPTGGGPSAYNQFDPGGEKQLVDLINQERAKQGIPLLQVDPRLNQAARKHTDTMVHHHALAHEVDGEPNIGTRFYNEKLPSDKQAENIAFAPTVTSDHQGIMQSPPHRANVLNPDYNVVGVGAVRSGGGLWVTEDFAHTSLEYSEPQADAVMQETINQYAGAQGMPPPARKPQEQLRTMACEMAKSGAVNKEAPAKLPGVDGILLWRTNNPAALPAHAREWLSRPLPAGYSLGSCFAPNPGRPGGIYWVVMVTY